MLKETLLILIVIMSGCITANVQTTTVAPKDQPNNLPEKLTGIWEYKGIRTSDRYDRGFNKVHPGQFKVYSGDGSFANFSMGRPNAIISSEGTWETISDSAIVEHVSRSIHSGLTGKDDTLYFKLNDQQTLYLKWHRNEDNNGNPANVWIEEAWRHVELPGQR